MPIIRDFEQKDGILIFDKELDKGSTYEAHHLESLREVEDTHFWSSSRRDKICQTFDRHVDKQASILEIGGGTGYVAEKLLEKGFSVDMADIHSNGLCFAKKRGIQKLFQFDLFYPPFEKEYDVVCLFDVLEHLKEEKKALACLKKILKPGGKLIFTVPAHGWLWSRDDHIAGHERRYTKKYAEKVLAEGGFELLKMEYFFSAIIPFLYLRRLLRKDGGDSISQVKTVDFSIHPLFNSIFKCATKTEFFLQNYLPNKVGGSLLALARI